MPYEIQDIAIILTIRAKTEDLQIEEEALKHLALLGSETSLRFSKNNQSNQSNQSINQINQSNHQSMNQCPLTPLITIYPKF